MKFYPQVESIKVKEVKDGVDVKHHNWSIRTEAQKEGNHRTKLFHFSNRASKIGINKFSSAANDNRQFCTTIVKYRNSKELHQKNLDYIQKEGKSLDGGKPELYGSDDIEQYKKHMKDLNWRIILSPDSNNIDLNVLTHTFIERMEKETGYKFTWIAANHYDTAKHHTHILINGIDKNGRKVQFLPKEYIKNMMRENSRDICTSLIGRRTINDIQRKKEEAVEKNYFTMLDKTIESYLENNILTKSYMNNYNERLLTKRLDYLISLGLCNYSKNTQVFTFQKDWKEQLKIMGKYNMYLDGFKYAKCSKDKYKIHILDKDGTIEGKILKKYIMQKDSNNFAFIIQKKDGNVSYVPLPFYPKDCFDGDTIKIENTKQNKTHIYNYSKRSSKQ